MATSETTRHTVLGERLRHPIDVEAIVDDRADAADGRSREDRKTGHMVERKRGKASGPGGPRPEGHRSAYRAVEEVRRGEIDGTGLPGGAAGDARDTGASGVSEHPKRRPIGTPWGTSVGRLALVGGGVAAAPGALRVPGAPRRRASATACSARRELGARWLLRSGIRAPSVAPSSAQPPCGFVLPRAPARRRSRSTPPERSASRSGTAAAR